MKCINSKGLYVFSWMLKEEDICPSKSISDRNMFGLVIIPLSLESLQIQCPIQFLLLLFLANNKKKALFLLFQKPHKYCR